MNRFFDANDARAQIAKYIMNGSMDGTDARMLGDVERITVSALKVESFDEPKTLRLAVDTPDGLEEAAFRVPGFLCSKTLPPILRSVCARGGIDGSASVTIDDRDGRRNEVVEHAKKLRQHVKVTAFGSTLYSTLQEKAADIFKVFEDNSHHINIRPSDRKLWDGEICFDFHSRYFTERKHVPSVKHAPFPQEVDPLHILEDLKGEDLLHLEENDVQYCEKVYGDDGSVSYVAMDPKKFQVGDFVELTVTFVCHPVKKNEFVVIPTLRALALLSSELRQQSEQRLRESRDRQGAASQSGSPAVRRSLKRKRLNVEDDRDGKRRADLGENMVVERLSKLNTR
ncbi:hypothetical protein EST38_g13002 [Candolleomyces aberdarensis]|uniref:Uncharacterized protein n=1 Tax=Candolleomyces aberdarensis TaxID=2316362 RepID=A0A4Q2D267_9AGAR|nr:hypothetical protein EST38_g13002 [Candolleomyces aberdarensis]